MTSETKMCSCELCKKQFQFGHNRYDGTYIPRYQITVCTSCWNANLDGWAPDLEGRLITHLQQKGIAIPERNCNGWLPRE
jgi:hypothetical protein